MNKFLGWLAGLSVAAMAGNASAAISERPFAIGLTVPYTPIVPFSVAPGDHLTIDIAFAPGQSLRIVSMPATDVVGRENMAFGAGPTTVNSAVSYNWIMALTGVSGAPHTTSYSGSLLNCGNCLLAGPSEGTNLTDSEITFTGMRLDFDFLDGARSYDGYYFAFQGGAIEIVRVPEPTALAILLGTAGAWLGAQRSRTVNPRR